MNARPTCHGDLAVASLRSARRAFVASACAIGAFVGCTLAGPALAAPVEATRIRTTISLAPPELAEGIGFYSEQLFDAAAAARWPSAAQSLQSLHEQARLLGLVRGPIHCRRRHPRRPGRRPKSPARPIGGRRRC